MSHDPMNDIAPARRGEKRSGCDAEEEMQPSAASSSSSSSFSLTTAMPSVGAKRVHHRSNETSRDFFEALLDWAVLSKSTARGTWDRNNEEFLFCWHHNRLTDVFVTRKGTNANDQCKDCMYTGDDTPSIDDNSAYHDKLYPMVVPFNSECNPEGALAIAARAKIKQLYDNATNQLETAQRNNTKFNDTGKSLSPEMTPGDANVMRVLEHQHRIGVAYRRYAWCVADAIRNRYRQIGALTINSVAPRYSDNFMDEIDASTELGFLDGFRQDMLNARPTGNPFSTAWCKQHDCIGDWLIGGNPGRYRDCGLCVKPRRIKQSDIEYDQRAVESYGSLKGSVIIR